ncbi:MAG: DUF4062 domain-containing protein [Desulfobacterales bacterium]|nr:DUF4062 domain-containing protein [Desulfobacterales bacterium]
MFVDPIAESFGIERFTAETRNSVEACLDYVRQADRLVGIVAWRYGWKPSGKNRYQRWNTMRPPTG